MSYHRTLHVIKQRGRPKKRQAWKRRTIPTTSVSITSYDITKETEVTQQAKKIA